MKKYIFLALMLSVQWSVFSQKKSEPAKVSIPSFKLSDQNEVLYTEVVLAENVSQQELYNRALSWFNKYYKNPAEVIKSKKENESIEGKGRFRINDVNAETGSKTPGPIVNYNITISLKEGRYKYDITKINQQAASYLGIEKWIQENSSGYRFLTANYLVQVDEEIKKAIAELKKAMSANSTPANTDW